MTGSGGERDDVVRAVLMKAAMAVVCCLLSAVWSWGFVSSLGQTTLADAS